MRNPRVVVKRNPQWEIEEAVLKDAQRAFEAAERERLDREAMEGAAS